MSKLTDRLDALGRVAPAPMGFAARPTVKATATMLLLGSAPAIDAAKYTGAEGVDAVIFTGSDALSEDVTKALEDTIWGVSVSDVDFAGLDALKDKGCDFVVPSSNDGSAATLRDDDMARGYEVDTSLTDKMARALEFLPVDLLLLTPPDSLWPLKLSSLIDLQATVGLVGSHFVLRVDSPPSLEDLEIIRNLPVDALLVDLSSTTSADLKKYRDCIDGLPPRKHRGGGGDHHDATMPQTGTFSGGHSHDHDDDDWDDRV
ncbi:MAG: hypothetical protein HOC77_06805 [Chloroflexi bacterium]|nr:hypothetical protein [Chloroflexota bacterium]MBT4514784.1 hypothetical protein [Chloroflexota bacterium]MBT5320381.1 hypothetical protein [Chloroflexota bacterium]MBT6680428.1 hypothetical protein [Chloroflexota bacterium]